MGVKKEAVHYADSSGSAIPVARSTSASFDDSAANPQKQPHWVRIRCAFRDAFSEFFGTMILVMFGDGVVAQVILRRNQRETTNRYPGAGGENVERNIGVILGVYTSGISGAHLNPAVTFANCVFREFPWRKLPIYLLAQLLGAMAGAAIVYGNYRSAIDIFEGGPHIRTVPGYSEAATAGIFCTYPDPFMTKTGQLFSEYIASAILMFMIFAIKGDKNIGAGPMVSLALFFIIFGIGACFGWETGCVINLARDFGPRLASYMLGYGHDVWAAGNYYFWVPMVAPFFGTTFGAWLYDMFLYVDESPVNTPWMGVKRIVHLSQSAVTTAV